LSDLNNLSEKGQLANKKGALLIGVPKKMG
jgi:hypothetical protein